MKTENRVWSYFAFLIALACVLLITPVYAGGDRVTQSNDMNNQTSGDIKQHIGVETNVTGGTTNVAGSTLTGGTQTTTTGSVGMNVGGDKNRAYAMSLGDVDINDCYRSYQIAVLFQGSQLNYWCMADSLDARGLHDAAAKTRCKLDGYRSLFDDETQCIAMNTMEAYIPPPPTEPESTDSDEDDSHKRYEKEIAALAEVLRKTQVQAKDAQRVAYNTAKEPKVIIQKEEFLDLEQRTQLEAIKHEAVGK